MDDSSTKNKNSLTPQKYIVPVSTIDVLILLFVTFQLIGQTLGNLHLMQFKPVPMILMIFMSFYSRKCDPNITLGLLLGLIGDLCLMFPTTLLFEIGAVFFLLGHICYIRTFTKNYRFWELYSKIQSFVPHLASTLIFITLIINSFVLWKFLPNKALFVLYGIILSSMAASSFYRFQQKHLLKYLIGICGAIAFMISDYLIAYSKFMGYEFNMKGALIMLLYYGGQFMIMKGNSTNKID